MTDDFQFERRRDRIPISIRVDRKLVKDLDEIALAKETSRAALARSALKALRDNLKE